MDKGKEMHETSFNSSAKFKPKLMPYEYRSPERPKRFTRRLGPGEVFTDVPNFTVTPWKKGHPNCYPNTSIAPREEHMKDEYDRKKELDMADANKTMKKRV
jgi:hypothetical protein